MFPLRTSLNSGFLLLFSALFCLVPEKKKIMPNHGRRRGNNDREASGSRVPQVPQPERPPPQPRLSGGTEIANERQPMKLHIIMLKSGVDIIESILGVAEVMKRGLVVISALGTVSKCVMPQNTAKPVHEGGVYQITSMSGTCVPGEPTGKHGDLTVMLSDRTGAVVGGVVESLISASNIQIVVGSFNPDIAIPYNVKQEPV